MIVSNEIENRIDDSNSIVCRQTRGPWAGTRPSVDVVDMRVRETKKWRDREQPSRRNDRPQQSKRSTETNEKGGAPVGWMHPPRQSLRPVKVEGEIDLRRLAGDPVA